MINASLEDDPGPLAGVPVAVKDLEDVRGLPTTYGSALYADGDPADGDSVLVERMRTAGAVIIGKTNTPEFGCKGTTDNPLFGATHNPWSLAHPPGGSSGGSAAALAADSFRLPPVRTAAVRFAYRCALRPLRFQGDSGAGPACGCDGTDDGTFAVRGPMARDLSATP